MWIARDKCGRLYLYSAKPYLTNKGDSFVCDGDNIFETRHGYNNYCAIDEDLLPEITFENSPKELVIKD